MFNIYIIVVSLILFISLYGFLKKNNKKFMIGLVLLLGLYIFAFSYVSGFIKILFTLKYLNIKLYILQLVIVNFIIMYMLKNDNIKLIYKIINYLYFVINIFILLNICLSLFEIKLYTKLEYDFITLMNISIILFLGYLVFISLIYIILNINLIKYKRIKVINNVRDEVDNKNDIYINGRDCSIIYEDSNEENIRKNYFILLNDINAPLVNGYTLDENIMLKNICTKLKTTNLSSIDLSDYSIFNILDFDEYIFLSKIVK